VFGFVAQWFDILGVTVLPAAQPAGWVVRRSHEPVRHRAVTLFRSSGPGGNNVFGEIQHSAPAKSSAPPLPVVPGASWADQA